MLSYLADTNIFIRFFMKDELVHYTEVENKFKMAQMGKIKILVLNEVVLEIEYVLRKVYKIPKKEVVKNLSTMLNMSYLKFDNRESLSSALMTYAKNNIDMVDALIHIEAQKRSLKILSFDKDFQKIKK